MKTTVKEEPSAAKSSAVRNSGERLLEQYLGTTIRDIRLRYRLTIADLSNRAGISAGMLSKIENGQTSSSLETLSQIANALGVTISQLFRDFNTPAGGAQLVKSGEGMEVVRAGTKRGHSYQLLAFDQGPKKFFDPFLVTINDKSEVFPDFEHPGTEFIYLLEGKLKYRHGRQTYLMSPGDSITFKGKVPHGPIELIKVPIRMLAITIYSEELVGS
jgi:transcriptional regulator with XRE-family HTH domain